MRLHYSLLICLLVVAAFNLAVAAQRLSQLGSLPPPLAETHPADAFAARLETISDPAELRRLALGRHQALLDRDHNTRDLLAAIRAISRTELAQNGLVLLLAGGIYFVVRRPARP